MWLHWRPLTVFWWSVKGGQICGGRGIEYQWFSLTKLVAFNIVLPLPHSKWLQHCIKHCIVNFDWTADANSLAARNHSWNPELRQWFSVCWHTELQTHVVTWTQASHRWCSSGRRSATPCGISIALWPVISYSLILTVCNVTLTETQCVRNKMLDYNNILQVNFSLSSFITPLRRTLAFSP